MYVKLKTVVQIQFLTLYSLLYLNIIFRGGLWVYYVIMGEGVSDFTQPTTIGGEGVKIFQKSYYVIYEQPLRKNKYYK